MSPLTDCGRSMTARYVSAHRLWAVIDRPYNSSLKRCIISLLMKEFKLCGLGNAVVDIFLEISDEEFASLGFERGGMRLVELSEQKLLLERYLKNEPKLVSGGSVPNSVIAFSQ